MTDFLKLAQEVIKRGRTSNNGKQYCYLTSFTIKKNEYHIVSDLNKQNAIAAYSKWTPDVIRFGKNAGMKLSEVDNKYLLWIAKGCTIYNDEYKCWEQKNFGGDVLQLSGTIKHGNYKEIDSTFLQRIKINNKL